MKQMKRLLFLAAVLLCAACEKDSLPEWGNEMPLETIEAYVAAQRNAVLDEDALREKLAVSVFSGERHCFHAADKGWQYVESLYGGGIESEYLFEADRAFAAGFSSYGVGWRCSECSYTLDGRRLVLRLAEDPDRIVLDAEICYFSNDRLILLERYDPATIGNSFDKAYFVGDFSSMTRDEFKRRYLASEK